MLAQGIVVPESARPPARIIVLAREAASVPPVLALALTTIAAPRADDLRVEAPTELARLRAGVATELGSYRRALLIGLLAAGAGLTALVVLADTLVRRRDLGRRRALGATRSMLVALVVARTAYAALGGVVLGSVLGTFLTRDAGLPLEFSVAVSVLTLLAALVAAVGPAAVSAHRDPVLVLRTP